MSLQFRNHAFLTLIRICDLLLVCASFLASLALSSGSLTWPGFTEVLLIRIKVANILLFVGYLALCWAVLSACGLYRSHRFSHAHQRLYELFLAVSFITGAFLVLKPIFLLAFATNKFLLYFWLSTFGTLAVSHESVLWLLYLARLYGRNLRQVIIVGEGLDATALAARLGQEASLGYRVLRIIDTREMTADDYVAGDS